MSDVIFDIDGTLADATHRLHWIKDQTYWVSKPGTNGLPRPNWEVFLSDEEVAKDTPIPETWMILTELARFKTILFITGRPDSQREITTKWLRDRTCPIRRVPSLWLPTEKGLYMRKTGDRRPSHEVKRELLAQARKDGFKPSMAFEDRIEDTRMWRSEGLRCFQVAEGDY